MFIVLANWVDVIIKGHSTSLFVSAPRPSTLQIKKLLISFEMAFLQNYEKLLVAMQLLQISIPRRIKSQHLWRPVGCRADPLRQRETTNKDNVPNACTRADFGSRF